MPRTWAAGSGVAGASAAFGRPEQMSLPSLRIAEDVAPGVDQPFAGFACFRFAGLWAETAGTKQQCEREHDLQPYE